MKGEAGGVVFSSICKANDSSKREEYFFLFQTFVENKFFSGPV